MKKSTFYIYITAVAALACLCGILFLAASPISSEEPETVSKEVVSKNGFSLEKAQELLSYASLSYSPAELQIKLEQQGFYDFEYFTSDNSSDGIAFALAIKKENTETKITAVFRGTYKEEWYSNFRIGNGTEHEGFSSAAAYCIGQIEDYINRHTTDTAGLCLELTGHSRGGAVANLTAKEFTDKKSLQNVYAYTFASPNTTTSVTAKDEAYENIYNIINPEDFICRIPLDIWGYTRYGINIELPKSGSREHTEAFSYVNEKYYELTGKNFSAYKNGYKDVDSFISACAEISPTLWDYYNKEIEVEPYSITLSEYMNSAATLLSGKKNLSDALLLVSGSNSDTLAPVTNFIMSGIDPTQIDENTDFTDSPLGCGHACETYSVWLEALNEDYFLKSISE